MGHDASLSCDTPEGKVEGRDVVFEPIAFPVFPAFFNRS